MKQKKPNRMFKKNNENTHNKKKEIYINKKIQNIITNYSKKKKEE